MIRFTAPAQQAKPGPPLSPILGQHGIKPAEFIIRFNTASLGYTPGVPLRVQILKTGTTWALTVKPPTRTVHLRGRGPRVDRPGLWALSGGTPQGVRTLFGTLKSLGYGAR